MLRIKFLLMAIVPSAVVGFVIYAILISLSVEQSTPYSIWLGFIIYFLIVYNNWPFLTKLANEQSRSVEEVKQNVENRLKLLDELFQKKSTTSTFKDENQNIHGGKLNSGGWSSKEIFRYISIYGLKIDDLDLDLIEPYVSQENKNQNELTIADKVENNINKAKKNTKFKNIKKSISELNDLVQNIKRLKKWIINNIENYLLDCSKTGAKMPYSMSEDTINVNKTVKNVLFLKLNHAEVGKILSHYSSDAMLNDLFWVQTPETNELYDFLNKNNLSFDLKQNFSGTVILEFSLNKNK